MTMHIVGPWLSTTGKARGKRKFRSAAEAQRARELAQDWENLKSKWGVTATPRKKSNTVVDIPTRAKNHVRDTGPRPASLNSWNVGAVTSKAGQQYTGTAMLGISQMAKSNAVPVFNHDHIVDIARMRR